MKCRYSDGSSYQIF
jgi:hypothetical protein